MTSAEIAARGDRWLRAIGYGLLAEISTIVSIIAIVVIHRHVVARGLTEADYTAFSERVGAIVGILGGTLYTFLFARLLMRQLSTRFVAHGIVVALAAVAFSVGGSIAGHQGVPSAYVVASALKISPRAPWLDFSQPEPDSPALYNVEAEGRDHQRKKGRRIRWPFLFPQSRPV